MSDRTDPAWDEYLSTGEDPTGGQLEEADEEIITDEITPGQWQQYSRQNRNDSRFRNTSTKFGLEQILGLLGLLLIIFFVVVCIGKCS